MKCKTYDDEVFVLNYSPPACGTFYCKSQFTLMVTLNFNYFKFNNLKKSLKETLIQWKCSIHLKTYQKRRFFFMQG